MRYTPAMLTEQVHWLARSLEVSAAIDDFQLSGDNAAFSAWLDAHACPPGIVREPRPTDQPTSTSRLGAGCGLITWHVIDDAVVGLPARETSGGRTLLRATDFFDWDARDHLRRTHDVTARADLAALAAAACARSVAVVQVCTPAIACVAFLVRHIRSRWRVTAAGT